MKFYIQLAAFCAVIIGTYGFCVGLMSLTGVL
jgi:hypothetical protein